MRILSWIACLALLCNPTLSAISQDAAVGEKAVDDTQANFDAALEKFNKLKTAIMDLRTKIQSTSSADARKPLIEEFAKAVDAARAGLDELRVAAEAAYKASPNKNDSVTQTLLDISRGLIAEDRNEKAYATLKLLKENKCDKKELGCLLGVAAYCLDKFDEAEKELTAADAAGAIEAHPMAVDFLADVPAAKRAFAVEQEKRAAEAKANDLPRVKLTTSKGVIVIELYENEAPDTVGNFISLVEKKYYDGLVFHRVLGNFMAQGGCPKGDGSGGPGYTIFCETDKPEHRNHFLGTLSMAKTAMKNTGGSQFFLTFRRTSYLDGVHTAFGRVIEGLDVLENIQRINPGRSGGVSPDKIVKAEVARKRDHEYKPNKSSNKD
jgi:cyclophilin family peptidyl-prolyl cis-trans isomerase